MKKSILYLFTVVVTAGTMVLISSCSKDDTEAPVITLDGANPFGLTLNATYSDPGASADDNEDGDISGNIVTDASDVNEDVVGSYSVGYSATDAAGNTGTASRTVNVSNSLASSPWTGSYTCTINPPPPPYTYAEILSISTTMNNNLEWSKFGDYSNATAKLNMTVTGSSINVPTQSFTCGNPAVLRQFSGSGTTSGTGSAGSTITLQIAETVNSVTANFTYTYTKL